MPKIKEEKTSEKVKKIKKVEEIKPKPKEIHPVKSADEIGGASPEAKQFNWVKEGDSITSDDFIISDKDLKSERYYEAMGRRKTAIARVRFYTRGEKQFLINNKPYKEYFSHPEAQEIAVASLNKMKCLDKFRVLAKVRGGGPHAQAEAIRHGTARVLVNFNPNFRKRLRKAGYLTRDPRMRERKKFGLKRARKAPQWAKR